MTTYSINFSFQSYLDFIEYKLKPKSYKTYSHAINSFSQMLVRDGIDIDKVSVAEVNAEWIYNFANLLVQSAPATQKLYLAVLIGWFVFLEEKNWVNIDIKKIRSNLRKRIARKTLEIESSPKDYEISKIIDYVMNLDNLKVEDRREKIIFLRDRAFILFLSDTGLNVDVICNLRRKDIDWRNGRIILSTEINKNRIISIPRRSLGVLNEYFEEKRKFDNQKISNTSHLFTRFDQAALGKSLSISTETARNIVAQRAYEALGVQDDGTITPKSFRHYFVSNILSSIDLLHPKVVQRCKPLFEIGHYDDAIFDGMKLIEEEIRKKSSSNNTDIGITLVNKAMNIKSPLIEFSDVAAEQEAASNLFRGAIGSFKNPLSHRILDTSDPIETFECLALASLLLRMLDGT